MLLLCSKCGREQDESEFQFKDRSTGRLSSKCKTCTREDRKITYWKNPEEARKDSKEYYWNHTQERIEYQERYRSIPENKEKIRQRDRHYWDGREEEHTAHTQKWREENPEKFKILKGVTKARRRAREKNAPGNFTTEQWMQKVEYYGWCCQYCGANLTPDTLTLDHVKPLSKGGSNWVANMVPACSKCNRKKWNHLDHLLEKIGNLKICPNNGYK